MTTELVERIEAEHAQASANGAVEAEAQPAPADPGTVSYIFAADLEPERVELPAKFHSPGSFVVLLAMDGEASTQWQQRGQPDREGKVDLAAASMELMLGTLVDYCFIREKRALNEPGAVVAERTLPPAGVARDKAHWKDFTKSVIRSFTRDMRDWLATECARANGLLPDQQKN